jgi:hypothetical protein
VPLASPDKEDTRAKKQELVPLAHDFIVAGARKHAGKCAVGDTRRKDRLALARKAAGEDRRTILCLIDAVDAVDAGDSTDIREDRLELATVRDLEVRFDARVQAVGPAFQDANVGAGATDH